MMSVSGACVYFLATDVWEDDFAIARVGASMSRCISASGDATPFLSVSSKVKPIPRTMLPWKLLPALAASRAGIRVAAAMEQERRDPVHRFAIQHPVRPHIHASSGDVENTDDHRGVAGPLDSLGGAVDLAAVLADPSQIR